jgi:hypothetical protein
MAQGVARLSLLHMALGVAYQSLLMYNNTFLRDESNRAGVRADIPHFLRFPAGLVKDLDSS